MRNWITASIVVAGLLAAGCTRDDQLKREHEEMGQAMATTQTSMKQDACSHCAGVQTATADGKCPMCGMKVQ